VSSRYYCEIVDNDKDEVITIKKSNKKTGKFLVSLPSGKNYGIAVKAPGYLFHSENFNIPQTNSYQEVYKDIYLSKMAVGTKIVRPSLSSTLRVSSVTETFTI